MKRLINVICLIGMIFVFSSCASTKRNALYYEGKKVAYFDVFQVCDDCVLAIEGEKQGLFVSDIHYDVLKIVCVKGNFLHYFGEKLTIKKPMLVGTYTYETKGGYTITVPVVSGEIIKK